MTNDSGKIKKNGWRVAAGVILLFQLLISGTAVGILVWLDLLPVSYVVLVALILFWLETVVYVLFYSRIRDKKKKLDKKAKTTRRYIKRGAGCTISALVMICCLFVSSVMLQMGNTIAAIAENTVSTDSVAAYVLRDNPAKTLEEARD